VARLVRPLVASLLMGVVVLGLKYAFDLKGESAPYLIALLVCVPAGAACYSLFLYVLWRQAGCPQGPERRTFTRVEKLLHKLGLKVSLVRN
jgi:hypothetical protein